MNHVPTEALPVIRREFQVSPLNIIVIETHDDVLQSTVDALSSQGYTVRGATTGGALDALLEQAPADLLILDVNLPHEDGLQISRRLRDAHPDIGIIIVTARSRTDDKVAGYASGADLYLVKPISSGELCAAIDALARRLLLTGGSREGSSAAITLNTRTRQLAGFTGNVDISKREADLLAAFAEATDGLLDTAQLLAITGGTHDEAGKHTLEVQLVRLRKKLEQAGAAAPTIKSIRAQGYQLCVPLAIRIYL
jgi:DNA-binding response OmpR family regulator